MKFRGVTFDVGGTLIEPFPSVGHLYAQVAGEHGIPGLHPEDLTISFLDAWSRKERFDYSRSAWRRLVERTFASFVSPQQVPFDVLYDRFAQPDAWRVFDDVFPVLQRLRAQGIRLGIVSNWDERLRPLLHQIRLSPHPPQQEPPHIPAAGPPLASFFEGAMVISYELAHTKPAPEIFLKAATLLQLPPELIVHIGDNRHEDFEGARNAGMGAILVRRNALDSNEITTLQGALDLLENSEPTL